MGGVFGDGAVVNFGGLEPLADVGQARSIENGGSGDESITAGIQGSQNSLEGAGRPLGVAGFPRIDDCESGV